MVKFSLLALAGALAAASAAPVTRTVKLANRKLRRGEPMTEALLRKARPYKAGANRRLENGEVQMDGSYNLKFSQCVDMKVYDEDLFDDETIEYAQAGQIVAVKSFVTFHVCQGDDCFYDQGDYDMYIVDLATYLANVATYQSNKRVDYCEKCNEFEDYCNAEDEEEAEAEEGEEEDQDEEGDEEQEEEDKEEEEEEEDDKDEQEEEEDDREDEQEEENQEENQEEEDEKEDRDGDEDEGEEGEQEGEEGEQEGEEGEQGEEDRKLKANRKLAQRKLANYIDCDQCQAYECFVDEENQDENMANQEEMDNQISEWIQGLAECKETGKQWGNLDLYVGAMCSPYGDSVELAVFVNDECTLYTNQKSFESTYNPYNDNEDGTNFVTYAEDYIKNAFSEVTSCLDVEYDDPDKEEEENNENEEQEYAMNEYCQGILEGDAIDFNNCYNNNENNNNAQEEENENNWYTYDMAEADDIEEVCYTLNQMNGEYTYYYDEEMSGTWHSRNKKGQIVTNDGSENSALTPGIIAVIVAVAVIVLAGAAFLCFKPKKKRNDTEAVYQGGEMN